MDQLSPKEQKAKTALLLLGVGEDVDLFLPDDLHRLYATGYAEVRKLQRARRERLAQGGLATVLCDIIMEAQGTLALMILVFMQVTHV